jgi:tetratricopeptide (TPR) repeat protein
LGRILLNEGKHHEADRLLESALNASLKQIESGNGYGYSYYNISSIYAVRNKSEEAFSWLRKAIDHGWRDNTIMRNDPCFENLRNEDRFLQMTEQIRAKVAETRRRLNEIEE